MKRAKTKVWCNNKGYEAGKIFTDEEVSHLDPNDFEDVVEDNKQEEVVKETKTTAKKTTTKKASVKRVRKSNK